MRLGTSEGSGPRTSRPDDGMRRFCTQTHHLQTRSGIFPAIQERDRNESEDASAEERPSGAWPEESQGRDEELEEGPREMICTGPCLSDRRHQVSSPVSHACCCDGRAFTRSSIDYGPHRFYGLRFLPGTFGPLSSLGVTGLTAAQTADRVMFSFTEILSPGLSILVPSYHPMKM